MVRVPINQWAGFLVYLFAITGISLLGTGLSSLVADQDVASMRFAIRKTFFNRVGGVLGPSMLGLTAGD